MNQRPGSQPAGGQPARGPRGGPHGAMMTGAKPKNTGQTVKRILSYMGEHRLRLVIVGLCMLITSASSIAGSYYLKPLINDYLLPFIGVENPDLSGFVALLTGMACIYLAGVVASYASNRLMLTVSTSTLYKIRSQMFSHMESLPIKYFDTHTHGELMSRFSNDIDTMRDLLGQGLASLVSSVITLVGVFVAMLLLSPLLTALILIMVALMMAVVRFITTRSRAAYRKQQKALGNLNGYIEEIMEGQKVVKVFCREDRAREEFDLLNEALRGNAATASTYSNMMMPVAGSLSSINYACTAIAGSLMAIGGMLDLGTVVSFLQYTRNFSNPINHISMQFASVMSALAGAERVFRLIDETPEVDSGDVTLVNARFNDEGFLVECPERTGLWAWRTPQQDGSVALIQVRGDVVFDAVEFAYEPDKTVLNGISLYAKPGQKIAFVGATGAGKTTITNLLNRFYDLPDGNILYDGIDINRIRKPDLRRSMAMVLQDTHLFTGTVLENIRYGRLDATDEEVVAAAKLANADGFIRHLADGYNTMLTGDGGNLSQGQRQLLTIARAAIADPPVLVLDEATSSIDTRTELLIERGMDSLMEGRTTFVIAHRLSTVRNSNAIVVLDHGEIIERGDHDDLIAMQGKYYQLYTGMFELE